MNKQDKIDMLLYVLQGIAYMFAAVFFGSLLLRIYIDWVTAL